LAGKPLGILAYSMQMTIETDFAQLNVFQALDPVQTALKNLVKGDQDSITRTFVPPGMPIVTSPGS
jgi:hypothetical protein